jgi:hypothetical protein
MNSCHHQKAYFVLSSPRLSYSAHIAIQTKNITDANYEHSEVQFQISYHPTDDAVRNRTLTLIEREDDTRSWGNFLVYFSHFTTMPYPPRGWGYIFIGC